MYYAVYYLSYRCSNAYMRDIGCCEAAIRRRHGDTRIADANVGLTHTGKWCVYRFWVCRYLLNIKQIPIKLWHNIKQYGVTALNIDCFCPRRMTVQLDATNGSLRPDFRSPNNWVKVYFWLKIYFIPTKYIIRKDNNVSNDISVASICILQAIFQ